MTKTITELVEENLYLLETIKYSEVVKETLIKRCAGLLANSDLKGEDFNKYFNRLKKVEYGK